MIELKDSSFRKYFTEDVDAPENPAAAYADHAEICLTYFSSLPESKSAYRYAPEKWSVKQLVGHLTDANLIFLYRLIAISRGETQTLPGFDENPYADNSPYDSLGWRAVLDAYRGVGQAAGALISGLDTAAWSRSGNVIGVRMTPRDMLWVLIGHERHHIRILKERYGLQ